jgi:hypothetical protein
MRPRLMTGIRQLARGQMCVPVELAAVGVFRLALGGGLISLLAESGLLFITRSRKAKTRDNAERMHG